MKLCMVIPSCTSLESSQSSKRESALAELILNEEDTNYALSKVYDYYSDFNRIDDYFRETKVERLSNTASRLFPVEDEFFHDFDMSPMDMDFEIVESGKGMWNDLFVHIGSFPSDENPGKNIRFLVKEKNTNTVVGFVRLGSPTINSKPRNDMLGGPPDLSKLNEHIIMGFVIVPAQRSVLIILVVNSSQASVVPITCEDSSTRSMG